MNIEPLDNIFRINLRVKPHERVLIFTDIIREDENLSEKEKLRRENLRTIAQQLLKIGKKLCNVIYFEYPSLTAHGIEPPEKLWQLAFGEEAIEKLKKTEIFSKLLAKSLSKKELNFAKELIKEHKNQAVNAVIALSNFSTSHTNFRDLLTKCCGTRYASMPLFDPSMLFGAMRADWREVKKRSLETKKILDRVEKIKIETQNGTNIEFEKGNRKVHVDTGILSRKGSFGNLPAGEVFLAPIENTAEGRLVIEWAPTRKLESPLIMRVEKGKVFSIEGTESYKEELEKKLNEREENRNIAELGIGTNDKASKPDNILESEKILGTIHIALGDNSSFGGKVRTPFHQDFIFFEPTVFGFTKENEKIKIIEKGTLLI
ncbi:MULTISPECIES: aminopeptidase [Thermodesulfovibrio]|jgi:leucyl aminopeptidase (aminopeptidase T)|uniref:aminopeptidase n=1 Tax=Thermodesulfovibrio TaxID=28261 RepID=UPI00260BC0C9|nr:aminopeptidase [Thermodesulfovibrio sp.]